MLNTTHTLETKLHHVQQLYNDNSFLAGGVLGSFYSWFNGIEVLQRDHLIIDLNQLGTLAINTIVGAVITTSVKFLFNQIHYLVTKKKKPNHE